MSDTHELSDAALERLRSLVQPETPLEGLVIGERYRVVERIARGGMGEVFRAIDLRLERSVAIKVLGAALFRRQGTQRVEAEVRTTSQLDHPGIVPIHDVGTLPDGRLFFVMKLVTGTTLAEHMATGAQLAELVRVLCLACEAVIDAHDRGIVHCDLKPANVMIDAKGRVFVLDWGIARVVGELVRQRPSVSTTKTNLTVAGAILGTSGYMSPEQARGEHEIIDERADVYSLGMILREMLEGPSTGAAPDPRAGPRELAAIAARATHPERERRYTSVRELLDDLSRWRRCLPVEAVGGGLLYRMQRGLRRNWRSLLVGLAGTALAIVLWPLLGSSQGSRPLTGEEQALVERFCTRADELIDDARAARRSGRYGPLRDAVSSLERLEREFARSFPDLPHLRQRLGVMYRVAMRYPDALRAQEEALALDPDFPAARRERGLLLARELRGRLVEADREVRWWRMLGLPGEPPSGGKDSDLRAALRADLAGASDLLARSLSAWAGGDRARAPDLLGPGTGGEPQPIERWEWLGYLAREGGDLSESLRAFDEGLVRDPGYVPLLTGRARTRCQLALRRAEAGADPGEDFQRAIDDCTRALRGGVLTAAIYELRGDIELLWGFVSPPDLSSCGARFDAALGDYERVLDWDPNSARAWRNRGDTWRCWVLHAGEERTDSRARARTMSSYRRAWKRSPDDVGTMVRLGAGLFERAERLAGRGGEAGRLYREAGEALGGALRLEPQLAACLEPLLARCRGSGARSGDFEEKQ